MDKVIVYTNPNCVQCEQTKKFLDRESIDYEVKDLTENKDDLVRFINMGFKSAPIVETEDDIWSGFRIDKLKTLAVRRSQ
jgi:glutaredoxin-like protein NrdH